ncbi:hypothetical protein BFP72_12920 [Reichenbachiella sp. 5M10]|nr:hypothetical protein BFP72_12920 [Reichenbachiella sp. 5M10]
MSCHAQPQTILTKNVFFEQLPVDLGLSQRSINCMLQDHEGYLWVGTWSGLVKYDGYSTQIYRADNTSPDHLRSNKIIRVFESSDSTLWVGTRTGGLFRKDKNSDAFYQYTHIPDDPNSLSNQHVWDIAEDASGGLWIGTEHGLNHLDTHTGKFTSFFTDSTNVHSLSNDFVTKLMIDSRNRLWVATEYGVSLMENIDPEHPHFERIVVDFDPANDGLHNYIYDLQYIENAKGMAVYWGTKKGLKKYAKGKVENFEIKGRASSFNIFRSMTSVSSVEPFLLLGSDMGLSVFDIKKNSFERFFGDFDKEVNLSQNTITALLIDRSGVLWAGTRKGLNKYDSYDNNISLTKTKTFDPTNSIITSIRQGPDGKHWIGTLGGGLFQVNFNGDAVSSIDKYRLVTDDDVDFTHYIQKLNVDPSGRFWIGTAGAGLYVIDAKDINHQTHEIRNYRHYDMKTPVALTDDYVMSIAPASSGGMWVGTWSKGLNLVTDEGEVYWIKEPRLSPIAMVTLYEDDEGYLWVGTRGNGLFRLMIQNKKVVEFKAYQYSDESPGINNNFVNTIYVDSKERMWVGTEDGLSRYDDKEDVFVHVNRTQDRLPQDVVGVIEDDSGLLWIAGEEGVTVINPDLEQMYVNHFDSQDRMQGGFFYNEGTLEADDGRLLLGGSNGFNIINPRNIFQNPYLPHVVIKDVTVSDVSLKPGEEFNGRVVLPKALSETDRIVLNFSENTISFEFVALHFANPRKNRYAYRLDGFDTEWHSTSSSRRYAKYTNLDPGTYTFTVRASNDDGLWNEEGRSLLVVISPPWWRTHWAVLLYVVLAMIFLAVFRKMILIRSAYEHDLRFERLERENTEQLNKSRLQFFTNISHEFRTPLTLILGLVEQLIDDGEGGVKVQKQLKLVTQNAGRLQRLINQLLDFRKAETGSLNLRIAEGNFYKFVKEVKLSFDSLAEQRGIDYSLVTSSNVIPLYFDRDQFEKILFNLLSNAFKHTQKGGAIKVQLKEQKGQVVLSVVDSGDGIGLEEKKKVFDRFYSGDQDTGTGSGIGLALCKSLVELHHGAIKVESEVGQGATFEVCIPTGMAHFKPEDMLEDFKDSEDIATYREVLDEEREDELATTAEAQDVEGLKKILIVEDNVEVRHFLKSLFQFEYAVFEAENGQVGIELANEHDPDLVISDVMMPVMDGITFCKKLKENLDTSHIPVILLTARTSFIYNIEGLENGADDYVTKPFHLKVLKLKARNLIKSREQSRMLVQDRDQLVLEPKMITVTSADEAFLQSCMDIIEENMDNSDYSVVEFGKEIGLSRMQLYRKLKALAGKSPNEFIRMMRIKRAAQLFEHGDFNVSEVTYQVGFTDPAYFRKCFKEQFGETPTAYIKNKRKKG